MAIPAEYITKIAQMFTQYGIRNITMDYIARKLEFLKNIIHLGTK